jgi:hypothetical protein
MTNWEGCGRNRSWPILRYYATTCWMGWRKPRKPSVRIVWFIYRELNTWPIEYKAGVMNTQTSYFGRSEFNPRASHVEFVTGWQSGSGAGFPLSTSIFPYQWSILQYSTACIITTLLITMEWYNRDILYCSGKGLCLPPIMKQKMQQEITTL